MLSRPYFNHLRQTLMQLFYFLFCTLSVWFACLWTTVDEEAFIELHYPMGHSVSIHKSSSPIVFPSTSAVPFCSPHTDVSVSWPHVLFSPSLSHPFLLLSCHSVVKWNEVSAEFIIPPAAVCQQQLSFPHVSLPFCLPSPLPLFVTLTAHLCFFAIFHSITSTPLSFSLIESIPSLLSPSLLFPSETGLSGRFSHFSTSSLVLFCLHVYVYMLCTPWWARTVVVYARVRDTVCVP